MAGVPQRLLVATRNEGKRRELVALLAPLGSEVVSLKMLGIAESPMEEEIERFDTFEENALAKARHFHAISGLPTVADDSGLAVAALGGAPGVRSRRWSGRVDLTGHALDAANNALLIRCLEGVANRRARFICAVAYSDDERELVCRGETSGSIIDDARGASGFGYDPHFFSDELQRTFGEASAEAKAEVSHRGRALRALYDSLRGINDAAAG